MTKITESRKALSAKDAAGLEAEVTALQRAHFGLRMQKAQQKLNNTATLRSTRREIARAKTLLAQKLAVQTNQE